MGISHKRGPLGNLGICRDQKESIEVPLEDPKP